MPRSWVARCFGLIALLLFTTTSGTLALAPAVASTIGTPAALTAAHGTVIRGGPAAARPVLIKPLVQGRRVWVPVETLSRFPGAHVVVDGKTGIVRIAIGRNVVVLQVRRRRFSVNGRMGRFPVPAAVFMHGAIFIPVGLLAHLTGISARWNRRSGQLSVAAPKPQVITCGDTCGGGGGSGNGGSGSSGPPIAKTLTTVYGWRGQNLNWFEPLNVSTNIPHAPSYLGGFPLGAAKGGVAATEQPMQGNEVVGTTAFGFASAQADQPMGIAYTSQAPPGVPSTVKVVALVTSRNLVAGLSGIGASCGATQVNWSAPTGATTDTLSTCTSTFQVAVPMAGFGSEAEEAVSEIVEEEGASYAELAASNPDYYDLIQEAESTHALEGVHKAQDVADAVKKLVDLYRSQFHHHPHVSKFTWDGNTTGRSQLFFTVDPQVMAADSGGGVELNFIASNVVFVVTEQFTENQYTYQFPVAEVGQGLLDPYLGYDCTPNAWCWLAQGPAQLVPGKGQLPAGMSLAEDSQGYVELTGAPAPGTQGVYRFEVKVSGASGAGIYHCTLVVAPAMQVTAQGASTYTYESGVGFPLRGNVLSFTLSGGVGCCVWSLVGAPSWLQVAQSPAGASRPGRPPVLFLSAGHPSSGTYRFELQAWDDYTSWTSSPLTLQILPRVSITSASLPSAQQGQPYSEAVMASGGTGRYTWMLDHCADCGAMPTGLTLTPSGIVTGTPGAGSVGRHELTLIATDAAGGSSTRTLRLLVGSPPLPLPWRRRR